MTQQVTELCLITNAGSVPFAVLVEQDGQCAWATGGDFGGRIHRSWAGHVLASKDRRPQEWWVLSAWRDWLAEIAQEAPEQRRQALGQLEQSTPGIIVKRPRAVRTRLPPDALAMHWRRHRLHNRAEVIGSEIAARLEKEGSVHWSAEVEINERITLVGDWLIAMRSVIDHVEPEADVVWPWGIEPAHVTGMAVIRVVDANDIVELETEWADSRAELGPDHPFGIAIIRHGAQAKLIDAGCVVGDRFPAAVTLAVAAAQAYQRSNQP